MDNIISTMIMAVGLLAVAVSVITQVIKELPILDKIPTTLVAVGLALILTPCAAIWYVTCVLCIPLTWYIVVAAIVAAFFVAFVAMFGWDKLHDIYAKYGKSKD